MLIIVDCKKEFRVRTEVSTDSAGIMQNVTIAVHTDTARMNSDTKNQHFQIALPNPPWAVFVYKPIRGLSNISNCFMFTKNNDNFDHLHNSIGAIQISIFTFTIWLALRRICWCKSLSFSIQQFFVRSIYIPWYSPHIYPLIISNESILSLPAEYAKGPSFLISDPISLCKNLGLHFKRSRSYYRILRSGGLFLPLVSFSNSICTLEISFFYFLWNSRSL